MAALSTLSKNPLLPSTNTSLDLPTDLSTNTNRQHEIQVFHQTQTSYIHQAKTLKQEIPTNWRSKSPKQEIIEAETAVSLIYHIVYLSIDIVPFQPNCYSKIVDILGFKHIIIFAMRKIFPGEELTYDYKFPREEDKIECFCGARKCKKYMN